MKEFKEAKPAALKPESLFHGTVTELTVSNGPVAVDEPSIFELENVEVPDLDVDPIKSIRTVSASKHEHASH